MVIPGYASPFRSSDTPCIHECECSIDHVGKFGVRHVPQQEKDTDQVQEIVRVGEHRYTRETRQPGQHPRQSREEHEIQEKIIGITVGAHFLSVAPSARNQKNAARYEGYSAQGPEYLHGVREVHREFEERIETLESEERKVVWDKNKDQDRAGRDHGADKPEDEEHVPGLTGSIPFAFSEPAVGKDFSYRRDQGREKGEIRFDTRLLNPLPELREANTREYKYHDITQHEQGVN